MVSLLLPLENLKPTHSPEYPHNSNHTNMRRSRLGARCGDRHFSGRQRKDDERKSEVRKMGQCDNPSLLEYHDLFAEAGFL
jgi:hypothetical protein